MDKLQKEKMKRRQSVAAVAGKNPITIKHNLSDMVKGASTDEVGEILSLSDTEVRDDVVIKKKVEVNKRDNSGRPSRIATIGAHKKLQPKVSRDSAISISSQIRRQSRSSMEQVNKFINSRDKKPKSESPARQTPGNRSRSSSSGRKKSTDSKNSPNNLKRSSKEMSSPNNPGKSPGNKISSSNPGKLTGNKNSSNPGKSPGNKILPNNPGNSPGNRKSPEDQKKSPSNNNSSNDPNSPHRDDASSKEIKVGERKSSSHDCSQQNILLVQSIP
ncbi:uncharacterized protein NPIL_469961 [Nephila pilipes]|uniref:Uncharacterized protein n=1 Tax=Nephila pilipes TaxID=299642 RepID=A0A8X6NGQ2_NEPPI|nr:uncharacterized protein NPIL_469961 [Nephila pilipes]